MSDFGDITDDDITDTNRADPEATARIFIRIRRALAPDQPTWEDLHPFERALLIFAFATLLDRLRREGSI